MRPAAPLTSSSTVLPRPFHMRRTIDVPSYSAHSLEPLSGCSRRRTRVFHVPNAKSKSCAPSRGVAGAAAVAKLQDSAKSRAMDARMWGGCETWFTAYLVGQGERKPLEV